MTLNRLLSIALLPGLLGGHVLADEPKQATVTVELRVIQLKASAGDAVRPNAVETGESASAAETAVEPQVLATTPDGLSVFVADGDAPLKLAGRVWSPVPERSASEADKTGPRRAENAAWMTLTAPRLACRVGQEASICVGASVPYMVKRDDGALVVERSEQTEGITVEVLVEAAEGDSVTFKALSIKLTQVVGRQPIPDVPFDVGRPILRSVEASVALSLSTRMQAVIGLPLANPDDRQVFVLVRAAPVESSDPEETAQP